METRTRAGIGASAIFTFLATGLAMLDGLQGNSGAYFLFLLAALSLVWTVWPNLKGVLSWKWRQPLGLIPEVVPLQPNLERDSIAGHKRITFARNQPFVAAIRISNEGKRNLASVIPLVEPSRCGAWWQDADSRFVPISEGIPLNVGAERLLCLAVRFYYPEAPATPSSPDNPQWYPVRVGGPSLADSLAVVAAVKPLGEQPRFSIRFRSEGVDQTIHCEAYTDESGAPAIRQTA